MSHPLHKKYSADNIRRFAMAAEGNAGSIPSDWYDLMRMLDDAGIEFTFSEGAAPPRFEVKCMGRDADYAEVYDTHEFFTGRQPVATFRTTPLATARAQAHSYVEDMTGLADI